MPDKMKLMKEQFKKKDQEIQYYKRMLVDVSNRHLRELEEVSKIKILRKEKEEIEEKLNRAKRMESIGLMAGGVAHDLNNILSGIINYPEILLMDLPADSHLRTPLHRIQESGHRAAAVVADLLTVARGVASVKTICDLNHVVNEYTNSPQHEDLKLRYPHIICEKKISSSPIYLSCSSVHVTKCIMNLVANAAEAIEGEGKICLTTCSKILGHKAGSKAPGKYAVLQVSDNGHGIKKELLGKIFEPFFTKKVLSRSGTGLGLSIVRNTMEDHNGYIEVTSGENGSCFSLYFPHSEEKVAKDSLFMSTGLLEGSGTILVVDDEEVQRDISSRILTILGYNVTTVSSGEEAVSHLLSTKVDLVLLDMILGKGMNGYDTYKAISEIHPNQIALIVSGFAESTLVQDTLSLGAGGFVKKPYTSEELGLFVKNILNT